MKILPMMADNNRPLSTQSSVGAKSKQDGGTGSGNFNHSGRQGEVGGSGGGGGKKGSETVGKSPLKSKEQRVKEIHDKWRREGLWQQAENKRAEIAARGDPWQQAQLQKVKTQQERIKR